MRKLDCYWMENDEWWHYNENLFPVINDDAPEEAKKSYEHYLEQTSRDFS